MSTEEVSALITLLQDDDPTIREAVIARLTSQRELALAPLQEACFSDNPRLRGRARMLHSRFETDLLCESLRAHLGSDAFDLEQALVLISRVENPSTSPERIREELARLAQGLTDALKSKRSPSSKVRTIGTYMAEIEGFRGNADAYYDPRNSYVDEVLKRRLGIPISLSVIYILVGRRAGLDLRGVGMPCHFLAQCTIDGEAFLVDPYGEGRILTPESCRALLAGLRHSFREDYLKPVSDRALVRRMIANLVRIYHEKNDQVRLDRFYGFVNALQSGS